jgi:hypothetical protein
MKNKKSSVVKGQVKIRKEKLPSRIFDKGWKAYDEFVEREMEDFYLQQKNAGLC